MDPEYRNIYKTARKAAGFTQEAAAEHLGICVESLRAYETGQRVPPNDVVEQMVICYDTQHLAYQHLKETNALMARIVPPLEPRSLLEVAVKIHNRVERFAAVQSVERLLEIAEDELIAPEEREAFEAIMDDLTEIIRGGLELAVFYAEGISDK